MSTFRQVLKEIAHRKWNFLLSVIAIVTAVAFFVASLTMGKASERETSKIMLGAGLNLRILPRDTDMYEFWIYHFTPRTMPESYCEKILINENFTVNHILASLVQEVDVRANEKQTKALWTGVAPERIPPGKPKKPVQPPVKKGKVHLGYQIARHLQLKKGDSVTIKGESFEVIQCLRETNNPEGDDIRIYANLNDVQRLLNLPGQVNEIKAIDCLCRTSVNETQEQTLERLRREILKILPDVKVFHWKQIAEMRHEQRLLMRRLVSLVSPAVAFVCLIWIGVLAFLNVRERRAEIGVMRALGYGSGRIAALFIAKALIIGLLGAAAGFALGTLFTLQYGEQVFKITAQAIKPLYALLPGVCLLAPVFAALASFIPTMLAVTQDPAQTLRQE
jgi:putative ABC transport system permease protein